MAVDALVHFDRADGDLLLLRFLKLDLFGFQLFQDLAADARALFRRQLLGEAVGAPDTAPRAGAAQNRKSIRH